MDLLSESSRAKQLEADLASTRGLLEAACDESSSARGEVLTLAAELHTVGGQKGTFDMLCAEAQPEMHLSLRYTWPGRFVCCTTD
jgi:hypothetical protein